jgi:hypothetical protein
MGPVRTPERKSAITDDSYAGVVAVLTEKFLQQNILRRVVPILTVIVGVVEFSPLLYFSVFRAFLCGVYEGRRNPPAQYQRRRG